MKLGPDVARLAAAQKVGSGREIPVPSSGALWPQLGEAAFHGLAGRFVRKIEPHSEADPVGILLQFLVLFGNLVGRSAYFAVEADRHFTNLFTVLVGETSIGRKGVSLNQARRLLSEVDNVWSADHITSGLSSGEGVIQAVRDPVEKLLSDKEHGSKMTVIDEGVSDKRLMLIESEMASMLRTLKRDGNILSSTLRSAWDGGDLRTLTKNSPLKATGAHISIISHITKPELLRHFDSIDAANGFGNRFLWCCVRRSKELPEGGGDAVIDFKPETDDLKEAAAFAGHCGEMKRDSEAGSLWRSSYSALTQSQIGLFGSIVTRAAPLVMRLACIYSLLDRSHAIRRPHLEAALALWAYCEDSARWIFREAAGDPVVDEVFRLLREDPKWLTRTEIHSRCGRHRSRDALTAALAMLRKQGRAVSEIQKTKGRSSERWRLCDGAT